ncbi:hypothetical protein RIF29_21949 [Crotalaria pallida]|uniref:EF-hand domain-containing protein n=1 Tax=Crotalaria pallida TaxID=3830 RepID=A0AAN9IDY6_CROPI
MNIAVVNSSTVTEFVDDIATFDNFVKNQFSMVDQNGDGLLSRDEIRGGLGKFMPLGSQSQPPELIESMLGCIFERFDEDKKGALNLNEFKCLMREIMHALARGIGGSPITAVLEQDSWLMKAVQREFDGHKSPP